MKGLIKGIVYAVLGIVGVVALALVLLVTLVDPNDYREDISRIAKDSAGIDLKLGGDLSWRFYPVLGFGASAVELSLQSGQPTLVKIGEMAVGVKLLPLLSQKIEIDALDIGGLQAHLVVDEKGRSNWEMPASTAESSAPAATPSAAAPATADATGSNAAVPELSIPSVRIHESSIVYEDKTAGAAYTVDLPLLELTNVNLQEAFPLLLEARIRDNAGLDVTTKVEGNVLAQLAQGQFGVQGLNVGAEVGGIFAKPVPVNLQGVIQFDQVKDSATVALSRLQFANFSARADIKATQVTAEPAFSGQLESDVFDAKALLAALAIEPPQTLDADAMTRVQLKAGLSGSPKAIAVKPLTLKLDDSTLSGDVSVIDLSKQAVRFALQLDKLDVDRYLPPPAPEQAAAKTADKPATPAATAQAAAELIPVETLRSLNLKGTFKAQEVIVQQIPMRDIGLSIKALNGDVQITDLAAQVAQGTLSGTVQVDARQDQPQIVTKIKLDQVEVADLMKPFVSAQLLSGRTSINLDTTTSGNDMDTLLQQALGQINMNMANTIIHGVNVNQVALDAVKSKLGDFSALMPDYQDRLPKALKGDTEIRNLLANIKVENGHLLMPDLNADTGEGQLSASGDIDLLKKGFDYRFGVVLSALDDNKYLKGARWPVRCKGSLETPASEWCRPDSKAVGGVLQQAASVALRDKGAQKLGEKLGLENADEAAVKDEVRKKAKEEEDKLKQKLGEKLNKYLNK